MARIKAEADATSQQQQRRSKTNTDMNIDDATTLYVNTELIDRKSSIQNSTELHLSKEPNIFQKWSDGQR